MRKIAIVVPRYGVEAAGGAEVLARGIAERLAAAGHAVSALTTCAKDHFTWENHYTPGRTSLNGVAVFRFPADALERDSEYISIQSRIARGMELSRAEEEKWIRGSVHSRPLYEFIAGSGRGFDALIFIPYLFGTTWAGIAILPEKSILIPCLHDEPYSRLGIFRDMFAHARGVIFNSEPERELALQLFGLADGKTAVAGMGISPGTDYSPDRFRKKFRLRGPFIVYAGRREIGKNTHLLLEYFRTFKRQNRSDLSLVLIGTGDVQIPDEIKGDVRDLGYLDEGLKHDCYAASLALCHPSVNESLSIVLMEAWLAGAAALVNGDCAVTSWHCIRSNGGLLFRDYFQFEECLLYLAERQGLREALATGGKRYVEREYSWPVVMKRYEEAFTRFGF